MEQQERINKRKAIIEALANEQTGTVHRLAPFWHGLKLIELALEAKTPIEVSLEWMSKNFPGRYRLQVKDMLETLQALGLVKVTQDRDVISYEISQEDTIAAKLIETLFE